MIYQSQGIWRDKNLLVIRKNAELPDICIKSNQPANGKRFRANFYWHHPAIYLLILVNLLVYGIVAIAVRKQVIVYLGVTESILQKRRRGIIIAWTAGILCAIFSYILFSISVSTEPKLVIINLLFLSICFILGGLIWGISQATIVGIHNMKNDYIWIRGVSKDYLAMLPEWKSEYLDMEWNK